MNNRIIQYLSKYIDISKDLIETFSKTSLVKNYPEGKIILKEGDDYNTGIFVLDGCLRNYRINNGEDITIDFFIEEQPVMPMGSKETIADFYLECLEDSVLIISTEETEKEIIKKHPELKSLCLKMSEVLADKIQKEYAQYKTSTPEERYLKLVEQKPELIQRVPQYKIASYLGVKPESLSRIKKRNLS